jgi:hypothetical protein
MDRLCKKHRVDAARARAGNNVGQYAKAQTVLTLDEIEQTRIDRLGS